MEKVSFNDSWLFYKKGNNKKQTITLPHDAMIHEERNPESTGGSANGYGEYIYEKNFNILYEYTNGFIHAGGTKCRTGILRDVYCNLLNKGVPEDELTEYVRIFLNKSDHVSSNPLGKRIY